MHIPSLALTTFSPSEASPQPTRGLAATAAIAQRETLAVVPLTAALQVTSTAAERPPRSLPISRAQWSSLPWYARLALLLVDARRDVYHALHAWAMRLPTSLNSPHHWGERELAELQSEAFVNAVAGQRRAYRECYDKVAAAVVTGVDAAAVASATSRTTMMTMENAKPRLNVTFEQFVWAVDCVRSRAFAGPLEAAPFRERLQLTAFVAVNTLLWPALNFLEWENALNGMY